MGIRNLRAMVKLVSDATVAGGLKMRSVPPTPIPVGFCTEQCTSPRTIYLHLPTFGDTAPLIFTDDTQRIACDMPAGSIVRAELVNPPVCEWVFMTPQPEGCIDLAQDSLGCFGQFWAFQFRAGDAAGNVLWQAIYTKPVSPSAKAASPLGTYLRHSTFAETGFSIQAPPDVEVNTTPE